MSRIKIVKKEIVKTIYTIETSNNGPFNIEELIQQMEGEGAKRYIERRLSMVDMDSENQPLTSEEDHTEIYLSDEGSEIKIFGVNSQQE